MLLHHTVYVTGCSLKADKKEHKVEVDDDEAEHQLSLKAVRKAVIQSVFTCRTPASESGSVLHVRFH